ncbi:hypothetical protein Tco_0885634 [Tanacetum coccineum]
MWGYELTLSSDNPNITDNASRKSVLVTPGSVVVPPGSVVVPPGSVVVPPGSVITTGSYNLFSNSVRDPKLNRNGRKSTRIRSDAVY